MSHHAARSRSTWLCPRGPAAREPGVLQRRVAAVGVPPPASCDTGESSRGALGLL